MPDYDASASESKPLTGKQVLELYEELRGQFAARNAKMTDQGNVYRGKHWDGVELIASRDRYSLTANYVAKTVDKSVESLVGIMPAIQVIPPGVEQLERDLAEQEEAVLYGTWHLSRMDRILRKVAHNVVLKNAGWVYIWWDATAKRVRYKSLPPENVYPVWDGDDLVEAVVVSLRLTRQLKVQYPQHASKIAPDSQLDDVIVDDDTSRGGGAGMTGTTKVIDYFNRDGQWVRVMGDATHTQNLNYGLGRVPLYRFENNLPGDDAEPRSEIDDVVELNRYYDQALSQQADIIKKYADPTIINEATGQSNVDVQRAVRADGGVVNVKQGGKLSFLNWEGTPPEIGAQLDRVKSMLHDLSGKPESAYGSTITNQSGVQTNLALTPVVAQTTARETLMGATLVEINADTLRLYEKFSAGQRIEMKGRRAGRTPHQQKYFKVALLGRDIQGWYENRIKWPSAYRVDDPVYVQNILSQAQGDHPMIPMYDALEELGREDVEGTLDRLAAQLEDPRFHPDRLKMAIDAATALGGAQVPQDLEGLAGAGGNAMDPNAMNSAAEAIGSPDRAAL